MDIVVLIINMPQYLILLKSIWISCMRSLNFSLLKSINHSLTFLDSAMSVTPGLQLEARSTNTSSQKECKCEQNDHKTYEEALKQENYCMHSSCGKAAKFLTLPKNTTIKISLDVRGEVNDTLSFQVTVPDIEISLVQV